jgi:hypothetical protein
MNLPLQRINEPAELRAVRHVLFHLTLKIDQHIRARAKLDDEVRAERSKLFLLLCG